MRRIDKFSASGASGKGILLFGRVTYDRMATFSPTPAAAQMAPVVAEAMNRMPKIVSSRTLLRACWKNTTVVKGILADDVRTSRERGATSQTLIGGSLMIPVAEGRLR